MSASPKIWLITGANAGFGRAMLDHVLAQGDDTVIAAVRRPETLATLQADPEIGANRLIIVKMDVSRPDEVAAAFEHIKHTVGRIDVLFNNAGYFMVGEAEAVPLDKARALFDCNFWGATDVMRHTVEFMRDVNKPVGGRILNMSSQYGATTTEAILGFYSATKHAFEAVSTALSKEVEEAWNIKVTILEPSAFLTDGLKGTTSAGNRAYDIFGHPAYTGLASAIRGAYEGFESADLAAMITGDPAKLSVAVYRVSRMEDPPLYLALGKGAHKTIRAGLERRLKDMDACEEWTTELDF